MRRVIRRVLARAGYRVHLAATGEEALRIADGLSEEPQILVTDVVMPGLSGPQLAQRLRRRWPGLPVVYVSGYTGDQWPDLLDDASRFVSKPFAPGDLIQEIEAAMAAQPALAPEREGTTPLPS